MRTNRLGLELASATKIRLKSHVFFSKSFLLDTITTRPTCRLSAHRPTTIFTPPAANITPDRPAFPSRVTGCSPPLFPGTQPFIDFSHYFSQSTVYALNLVILWRFRILIAPPFFTISAPFIIDTIPLSSPLVGSKNKLISRGGSTSSPKTTTPPGQSAGTALDGASKRLYSGPFDDSLSHPGAIKVDHLD
jgi:hypothetical protein